MNTSKPFSQAEFRAAVAAFVAQEGMTRNKLAKRAGLDWACVERFLNGEGITAETVEKLWPHVFPPEGVPPVETVSR